jgi:hypothetical protein
MQVIPQKVSSAGSSMSIIHCEETASWPVIHIFELWLSDIENNAHSIFIVISEHTLIGIRSVSFNNPIIFRAVASFLE